MVCISTYSRIQKVSKWKLIKVEAHLLSAVYIILKRETQWQNHNFKNFKYLRSRTISNGRSLRVLNWIRLIMPSSNMSAPGQNPGKKMMHLCHRACRRPTRRSINFVWSDLFPLSLFIYFTYVRVLYIVSSVTYMIVLAIFSNAIWHEIIVLLNVFIYF